MQVCPCPFSSNLLDYPYSNIYSKSLDAQFTPGRITIPPTLPKFGTIRRNYLGIPCPTLAFEVSHTNESYPQMVTDAHTKAFARTTSIQIYVGLKVYASRMRSMWG